MGPTGHGSITTINTNTGSLGLTGSQLNLYGHCGVITSVENGNIMFGLDPNFVLFKFIVDENMPADCLGYNTLSAAITTAENSTLDTVTITVFPGTYKFNNFVRTNTKNINIVSSGVAPSSVTVTGNFTSLGNTFWNGITFSGLTSVYNTNYTYTLNNITISKIMDVFVSCEFTDNYALTTIENELRFRQCLFTYEGLTRDRILSLNNNGNGIFNISRCDFRIVRTSQSVNTFFWINSSSADTITNIDFSNWIVTINNNSAFYLIQLRGSQPVSITNNNFNWVKTAGIPCVLIGHNGLQDNSLTVREINNTARFQMFSTKVGAFHYDSSVSNLIISSNLWSGISNLNNNLSTIYNTGISITYCQFNAASLIYNTFKPDDYTYLSGPLESNWILTDVTFISVTGQSAINMILSQYNIYQIQLYNCVFISVTTSPILNITGPASIGTGPPDLNSYVTLEVVNTTFKSANTLIPPWLQVIGMTNYFILKYNNITLNGVAVKVDPGIPLPIQLPLGP
jgi:hypothetical protein